MSDVPFTIAALKASVQQIEHGTSVTEQGEFDFRYAKHKSRVPERPAEVQQKEDRDESIKTTQKEKEQIRHVQNDKSRSRESAEVCRGEEDACILIMQSRDVGVAVCAPPVP